MTHADVNYARALLCDPRADLGIGSTDVAQRLRRTLQGLLAEIDWLRVQLATTDENEATFRLRRARQLHVEVFDPDGLLRCGICAQRWPCGTVALLEGQPF